MPSNLINTDTALITIPVLRYTGHKCTQAELADLSKEHFKSANCGINPLDGFRENLFCGRTTTEPAPR